MEKLTTFGQIQSPPSRIKALLVDEEFPSLSLVHGSIGIGIFSGILTKVFPESTDTNVER